MLTKAEFIIYSCVGKANFSVAITPVYITSVARNVEVGGPT